MKREVRYFFVQHFVDKFVEKFESSSIQESVYSVCVVNEIYVLICIL